MKQLQELLDGMDIPSARRTDLRWLSRNVAINNGQHPNIAEVLAILNKERGKQ